MQNNLLIPGMWPSGTISALGTYFIWIWAAFWWCATTEFPAPWPWPWTWWGTMGSGWCASACPMVPVPPSVPISISTRCSCSFTRLSLFKLSSPSLHLLLLLLLLQDRSPPSSTNTHYCNYPHQYNSWQGFCIIHQIQWNVIKRLYYRIGWV